MSLEGYPDLDTYRFINIGAQQQQTVIRCCPDTASVKCMLHEGSDVIVCAADPRHLVFVTRHVCASS